MASYIDKVNFYNEGGGLQKSVPIQDSDTKQATEKNASDIKKLQTSVSANSSAISSLKTSVSANSNAISSLKTSVTKNSADIKNLQTSVSANRNAISDVERRGGTPNILVIGDSNLMGWGGVTVWASTVKSTYPGFFDYDFDGGAGFGTSEYTFQSILTRKAGKMSAADRSNIDIIAVFGGVNDRTSSAANIIAGMKSFATIAKTNFPNACVKLFGMFTHIDIITDWQNTFNALQIYRSCSLNAGGAKTRAVMTYITNSEYVTHRYDIFQDGIHLTQTGQNYVLEKAVDGIISGSVSVAYQSTQTIKDSMQLVVEMINNVTTIKVVGKANVTIPTGKNLRSADVATIPKILVNPVTLDLAFACGYENENYLGIMPFAGDVQLFSPSAANMTIVARLYAHSTDLMNWVVDNVTARACNYAVSTDLV